MTKKTRGEVYNMVIALKNKVNSRPMSEWDEAYRDLAEGVLKLADYIVDIRLKTDGRGRPAGNPYAGLTAEQRWFLDLEKVPHMHNDHQTIKVKLEALRMRGYALGLRVDEGMSGHVISDPLPPTQTLSAVPAPVSDVKVDPNLKGF